MSAWHALPLPERAGKREWPRGWPARAEAAGTAGQPCPASCDIPGRPWLGSTVSPGHGQYNVAQELDGDLLLSPRPIEHPGRCQRGWRWSCGHRRGGQGPSQRARPQRWGLLGSSYSPLRDSAASPADCRAATRRGSILWHTQHPLRSLGLQLNQLKKIHLASKILSFKAISSPGSPGWCIYGELNWNQQNIWRGRMKTEQLGKQMFFFLIMLRTLSNGSPWSFLIK